MLNDDIIVAIDFSICTLHYCKDRTISSLITSVSRLVSTPSYFRRLGSGLAVYRLSPEFTRLFIADAQTLVPHRHVLPTTTSSTVGAVGSSRHDRVHFWNRDRWQEDDIFVNDTELHVRTTTNDFSIASHVCRVLVRRKEPNRTTNDLEHLGRNDVRVLDVGITE